MKIRLKTKSPSKHKYISAKARKKGKGPSCEEAADQTVRFIRGNPLKTQITCETISFDKENTTYHM